MLFDEKDLSIFENSESKVYFKEILQLYYSKNYRSCIVMLYSFVIYDLFIKMQTMATEGDKKASKKLQDICEDRNHAAGLSGRRLHQQCYRESGPCLN